VHDLRHRMVVRRIQSWHAQGVDVDSKIPLLATYLGHVEVRELYWYYSDSRVIPIPVPWRA
jgi:integrase